MKRFEDLSDEINFLRETFVRASMKLGGFAVDEVISKRKYENNIVRTMLKAICSLPTKLFRFIAQTVIDTWCNKFGA
jgi:hypothetical protein